MNNLALGCREIEALCRERAMSDSARSWKWLGEADRWSDLAHREIAFRFQNNQMHAGSMAMGPNTIEATRTDRSTSRSSACNPSCVADNFRARAPYIFNGATVTGLMSLC